MHIKVPVNSCISDLDRKGESLSSGAWGVMNAHVMVGRGVREGAVMGGWRRDEGEFGVGGRLRQRWGSRDGG